MKKDHKPIIALLTILLGILLLPPMVQAKAQIPYQFRESVTKEKEIVVTQRSYLKVTSTMSVNHMVYQGKIEKPKSFQAAFGKEAYFALKPGTYHVKSSSFRKFKVKYKLLITPENYAKNTTKAKALKLEPKTTKIAATFSKNKKGQTKRYYKIVATKNRPINYSAGILYNSQGNLVPSLMHKEIYPVYGKEPDSYIMNADATNAETTENNTANNNFAADICHDGATTINPLKKGETYYLEVTLGKQMPLAIPVTYRYLPKQDAVVFPIIAFDEKETTDKK